MLTREQKGNKGSDVGEAEEVEMKFVIDISQKLR